MLSRSRSTTIQNTNSRSRSNSISRSRQILDSNKAPNFQSLNDQSFIKSEKIMDKSTSRSRSRSISNPRKGINNTPETKSTKDQTLGLLTNKSKSSTKLSLLETDKNIKKITIRELKLSNKIINDDKDIYLSIEPRSPPGPPPPL